MKKSTALLTVVFLLACGIVNAAPVTLTFDDSDQGFDFTSPLGGEVPDGYGGLNWENLYYSGTAEGNPFLPPGVAYNGLGYPALVTSTSGDFDLLSVDLGVAGSDELSVLVVGFNLQEMRLGGFQNVAVAQADGLQAFDFNFNDIDTLFFYAYTDSGFGSGYPFLMDNFTYDMDGSPAVPIPATLLLLGSGLLGLIGFRRTVH